MCFVQGTSGTYVLEIRQLLALLRSRVKRKLKTEVQGVIEGIYRHVPQAKSPRCMRFLPLTVAGREERFAGL